MRNNLKDFLKDLRLENEHIILRHFIFEDNRAIYSLLSDKDSCYFDGGYEPYERYNEKYLTDFKSFFVCWGSWFSKSNKGKENVLG